MRWVVSVISLLANPYMHVYPFSNSKKIEHQKRKKEGWKNQYSISVEWHWFNWNWNYTEKKRTFGLLPRTHCVAPFQFSLSSLFTSFIPSHSSFPSSMRFWFWFLPFPSRRAKTTRFSNDYHNLFGSKTTTPSFAGLAIRTVMIWWCAVPHQRTSRMFWLVAHLSIETTIQYTVLLCICYIDVHIHTCTAHLETRAKVS